MKAVIDADQMERRERNSLKIIIGFIVVCALFPARLMADVEYLIYSDGMPANAFITIGNQTFSGLNPEGVTFNVAKELKESDIVVSVDGGYVYVLGLDNANHQIRVNFRDALDPTAGPLACATTMYALPGAEYIHKLLPAEGEHISGVTFGDGLTGLRFCTDRQEVGNKYVYVAGTAPTTEGIYTYDVLLAGGTHATVTLTVSAYLASPTPLMGWLSWNWFESWAEQDVLVANAKAMKERGLVDAGWRYFILDDKWAVKGATKEELTFDTAKFPAMTGEGGFNTIMHSLGFRTGIYSDAGSTTCAGWQEGSYGYETQHLALFDAWGFDMLKYDFCNNQAAAQASYKPMGDAIRTLNVQRQKDGKVPFAFNICEWGQNEPWKWGAEAGGNSWRCTYDSRECWMGNGGRVGVVDGTDLVKNLWMYAGVNRFNDADMMMIGLHGCGSSSNNIPGHTVNGGGNLPSPFTAMQARSQMSVWCMLASPLTICADFRDKPESRDNASATLPNPLITADDMGTLTNKDIIGINQDLLGQQAEYMKALSTGSGDAGYDIFVKDLSGGRRAVAVFNRSADAVSSLSFRLADAYLPATATYFVKDIWAGTVRQVTSHFTTGDLQPYETKVFLIGTEQMDGTLINENVH